MYCKTFNGIGNKTLQYLTKAHDILKDYGIFNRFKIKDIVYRSSIHTTIEYKIDEETIVSSIFDVDYNGISIYPEELKNTLLFLFITEREMRYDYIVFNEIRLLFNEKEITILTLAATFALWDIYYSSEGIGKHVKLHSMELRSKSIDYELNYVLGLPRFNIGRNPISFKIINLGSEIVLHVIEPENILEEPNNDIANQYRLSLTFGKEEDKNDINDERTWSLLEALDGKIVSTDTNLRDLYFNAHRYLLIANIKEEKLVSITVNRHGTATRYLGGLYSGFSMSMSKTYSPYITIPFPITNVTIGGQDVSLACSMLEIETALDLN